MRAWKDKANLHVYGCGLNIAVAMGRQPIRLNVNIDIPHMPITTDGKEPDAGAFERVLDHVAAKAIRGVKRYSSLSLKSRQTKKSVIVENISAGAALASGNGQFRFSQRQLFYAIRPRFMKAFGNEPAWNYFCQVITEYENEHGDIAA